MLAVTAGRGGLGAAGSAGVGMRVRFAGHGMLVLPARHGKIVGDNSPGIAPAAVLALGRLVGVVGIGSGDLEPLFAVPALILVGWHALLGKGNGCVVQVIIPLQSAGGL